MNKKLSLVLMLMSSVAWAEETALPTSGECGTDCYWSFEESTKTIRVTGSGYMDNYAYFTNSGRYTISAEWAGYRDVAENIIIDGVKTVGNSAFLDFQNVKNVEMNDSVTALGNAAFAELVHLEKIKLSDNIRNIYKSALQDIGKYTDGGVQNLILPKSLMYLADLKGINVNTLFIPADFSVEDIESSGLPETKIKEMLFTDGYNFTGQIYQENINTRIEIMYCTEKQMQECSAALRYAKINIEPTQYALTDDGVVVYDKKGRIVGKYADKNALGAGKITETYKYDSAGHLVGIFDGNGQRTWGKKIYTIEEAMEATKNGDKFHVYLTYK